MSRILEQLKAWRGLPQAIRSDNGPEVTSQVFVDQCEHHQIEIRYLQPGKLDRNAFAEWFNRTYREAVLNSLLFEDLDQVQEIPHQWLIIYSEQRPHDALGGLPHSNCRNLSLVTVYLRERLTPFFPQLLPLKPSFTTLTEALCDYLRQ